MDSEAEGRHSAVGRMVDSECVSASSSVMGLAICKAFIDLLPRDSP
jgi:hypothetical protein